MEAQNPSLTEPFRSVPTGMASGAGNRLEGKIRTAQGLSGEKQRSELKKVSQEFEALFVAYLLKIMRETIEEAGLLDEGFGKTIYMELFDQEISQSIAKRGALGIGDLLHRNLVVTKSADNAQNPISPPEMPPSDSQPALQVLPTTTRVSDKKSKEISELQLPILAPVSSAFGLRRDPFTHRAKFHKGLDLAAPEGMKVLAALPGTVMSAGYESGYGNTVLIQHNGGLQTRYGHLGTIDVKAGDVISAQMSLGTVGNTGHSTGPHLHFEVMRMGKPIDPMPGLRQQLTATQPISDKLKLAPEFERGQY